MFALGLTIGIVSGAVMVLLGTVLGYRCAQAWNQQDDDA